MSPHAEMSVHKSHVKELNGFAGKPISNGHCQLTPVSGLAATSITEAAGKSHLQRAVSAEDVYDLVCVGFGPANLALAISLHDALDSRQPLPGLTGIFHRPPKVLFLERQEQFGWHKGMLLAGAKMQISFVKDLATLRNPRSEFTFLNYLHKKKRLASFTNLNTFLPQRVEYEDYMKWCSASFDDVVEYGQEVLQICAELASKHNQSTMINSFEVVTKDVNSGNTRVWSARNVVLALGGKPQIPASIPQHHPRIFHSAHYSMNIDVVLPEKSCSYTIAVLGCGQSAAEIFNDLHSRYPNAKTKLLIRGAALKPSDDSPFVNEIFDPEQVDPFYDQPASVRQASITHDRGTNYGVVRIGLLEHIYETMYMQRLCSPSSDEWQHQILTNRQILDTEASKTSVKLRVLNSSPHSEQNPRPEETINVDALIVATGYTRSLHEEMLRPMRGLISPKSSSGKDWSVSRDYKIKLNPEKVGTGSGIWLTGCNEDTHGLSDTLLSVLATRGDDLIRSIFGD